MIISGKTIDNESPCFIVAEAGLAHNGNFENAIKLIDLAVEAGADAVKFQVYRTKELISEERSPDWFERFQKKELPYEAFAKLKEYAEKNKIIWFATPHTESAFEYLRRIDVPCYKVGSGEHDFDFIDKIADTGKPLIISSGMRTHYEVLRLIDRYGSPNTAFLHCVTDYPTLEHLTNLGFIDTMKCHAVASRSVIGYSDHAEGTYACELAAAKGAKIIEKHICLDDTEGQDVKVSLQGKEVKNFVKKIRQVERMVGSEFRGYSAEERENEKWALKSKEDNKRPL